MYASFRRRKHYTSQNVLAAVDFDMRFTYMLAGWEGSDHDASILADSLSRPDGLQIPEGKFYLGDAGYACRPDILPPFRKTRYHLNEFSPRHRPQNAKELFNLRHSSLRITIERVFAALKTGWGEDEFFEEVVTFDEVVASLFSSVPSGSVSVCRRRRRCSPIIHAPLVLGSCSLLHPPRTSTSKSPPRPTCLLPLLLPHRVFPPNPPPPASRRRNGTHREAHAANIRRAIADGDESTHSFVWSEDDQSLTDGKSDLRFLAIGQSEEESDDDGFSWDGLSSAEEVKKEEEEEDDASSDEPPAKRLCPWPGNMSDFDSDDVDADEEDEDNEENLQGELPPELLQSNDAISGLRSSNLPANTNNLRKRAVLDARTDASAGTAELEVLQKELEVLEERA
ncbi:hypothetical protein QYE76_003556 [Lolium multiflorum]|uniref:DDE Tnp4 domain-containing protein n=1 Tax=Lolium multiflorum TaxID=4521 RepID=A0AAD8RNX9_LOLMU|nr:hypothetical protein QYE76_003556 [Lolium multiflorum]